MENIVSKKIAKFLEKIWPTIFGASLGEYLQILLIGISEFILFTDFMGPRTQYGLLFGPVFDP